MKKALMSAGCPENCADDIVKAAGVQGFDWTVLARIFSFYSMHKDELARFYALALEFWAIVNPPATANKGD